MNYLYLILFAIASSEPVLNECQMEWAKILEAGKGILSPNPSNYTKMFMYSGFTLNNLGQYDSCNELSHAKYVIMLLSGQPPLLIALCGPKVCNETDYQNIFPKFLSNSFVEGAGPSSLKLPLQATSQGPFIMFSKEFADKHFDSYNAGAILMIIFTAIIVGIIIIATAYEYWITEKASLTKQIEQDSKPPQLSNTEKYLLCFSLITNLQKLFLSRSQEKFGKKDTLEVLNAMRVLSIGWVILGHTIVNAITISVLANPNKLLDFISTESMVIPLTGTFSVDTFFWISGFLVSYLLIIEINNPKKVNWIMIYIHRYLRIVPLYLFIILFSWALQKHMGSGPMWWNEYWYNNDCKKWWWTNILFVNNLVPDWKGSNCLGQSWYLADDMQFFIITPPILYLYHKFSRYIGWAILTFLIGFSIIISGVVAHHFTLNAVGFSSESWTNYNDYYYIKPYCRVGVYALGIITGIIVYSYRQYQSKQKVYDSLGVWIGKQLENKIIRYIVGFFGLALINIIIWVEYDTTKHPGAAMEFPNWTDEENQTFIAFNRFVYGLGLTLILLPTLLGHFTWIIWIMSLEIWTPLARLTFCCYLVQSNVIDMIYHAQTSAVYLDNFLIFKDATWNFMFSFLIAWPFVLMIEMPALAIEKLMFSSVRAKQPPIQDEEKSRSLLVMKKSEQ